MNIEKVSEFIVMLLLERLALDRNDVTDYLKSHYDLDKFNSRYSQLFEEFLNPYALNKTEKSE